MSKHARLFLLCGGILAIVAMLASTASASSWTNSGDTAFSATSGAATISTAAATMSCTGSVLTASAGLADPGPVWVAFADGFVRFSLCRIGGTPVTFACFFQLNATGQRAVGPPKVTDVDIVIAPQGCSGAVAGVVICTMDGTIRAGTYTDPAGAANGRLDWPANRALTVHDVGRAGSCPFGNNVAANMPALSFPLTVGRGGPAPNQGPRLSQP